MKGPGWYSQVAKYSASGEATVQVAVQLNPQPYSKKALAAVFPSAVTIV